MANPFAGWTPAQVLAHNERVSKRSVKEVGKTDSSETKRTGTFSDSTAGIPVSTGRAHPGRPNTRTFTNLAITPSTDEQRLNKLERAWLRQLEITHPQVGVQSLTLKLGDDCRYTPDFWTVDPDGQLFCWECKGFMRDDALVKIKTAARMFRHFRFVLVTREKGQWQEKPINP